MEASPQPNDDSCRFEDFLRDDIEIDMDQRGYYFITSEPVPDEAIIRSLEDSIGRNELYRVFESSPTSIKYFNSSDYPIEVKKLWQKFMEHGINLDIALLPQFKATQDTIRQGPIIYCSASSTSCTETTPRRVHPCHHAISIWRPMRSGLGPENGLFKVYPGSHHLRSIEELRNSGIHAIDIRIRADQVLITHGGLWIEEGSGPGLLMWMGVSVEIIGLHIDMYSLGFIALAHGASRFLSRRLLPRTTERKAEEPAQGSFFFAPQDRLTKSNNSRSETAGGILTHAMRSLEQIEKFITELGDPTSLILLSDYSTANDPRAAFLSVGRYDDSKKWFMRALAVRHLIQRYYTRKSRSIPDFIQGERLPNTAQITNAVKYGQKLYLVERSFESSGVWLALMSVLSKFPLLPLSEAESIPQLLLERYSGVLEAASRWSRLMDDSSRLYSTCVTAPGFSDRSCEGY